MELLAFQTVLQIISGILIGFITFYMKSIMDTFKEVKRSIENDRTIMIKHITDHKIHQYN